MHYFTTGFKAKKLRTLISHLVIGLDMRPHKNPGKNPDDGKAIHYKTHGNKKGQHKLILVDVGVE